VTGLPSLDVVDLDLGDVAARPDEVALRARLRVAHAARRAAGRLLISVVPFAGGVSQLPADADREQPVRLGHAYAERDTVRFVFPEGYGVHSAPDPVEVEGPVGRYALRVTPEDGALAVVRELVVDAPRQPAEAYDEVRAFFAAVAEADASRAVLKEE
jgi:hypothetical protein